ncbi:MAG: ATP-binding protein [Microscillaceae bacterium]|nr:ATP-binding protein [Microscillaceae bacterium]
MTTFLGFTLLIISLGLLSVWFYAKIESQTSFTVKIEQILLQTLRLLKTEQNIWADDLLNEDFYKVQKSQWLAKHDSLYQKIQERLVELPKSANLLTISTLDDNFLAQIAQIKSELDNYYQAFREMLRQYQKLGFKNTGLMGEIRILSDSLAQMKNIASIADLLKIQKLEQSYFISKDGTYADSLTALGQSLSDNLSNNRQISDNQQVVIKHLLENYTETFKKIVAIEFLIGVKTDAGLKIKAQDFADKSTKLMLNLVEKIRKEANKNKLYLRNSFLAIIAGMVLLSIFLSYWQAGQVAQPITRLSRYIRQVIDNQFNSDFDIPLKGKGQDEVAQLTVDFQLMLAEIKRNWQAIQEKNLALENHNQELNAINHQLAESENRLNRLNSVKDKMFSIISHDLRSPLNSMLGFFMVLEMQSDAFSPEETRQFSQETQKSVKRLVNLLDNLLQWSMSQTGEIEFKPQSLKLAEIIAENLALYHETAARKGISLVSQIADNQTVKADENMLNFIIRNLLSNAIKFSNIDSEIKFVSQTQANQLIISIIDQGVGMSAEQAAKIFDAQEHTSTIGTQSEKGTGLGLPLCQSFVERNGGKIWVNSVLNQGTTFSFTLPLV